LGLPRSLQKRLLRTFGSPERLSATINEFRTPRPSQPLPQDISALIQKDDEAELVGHIKSQMVAMGHSTSAGRHPQEIARRLREKLQLDSVTLSENALNAMRDFLALRIEIGSAVDTLAAFAKGAGITIDQALAEFEKRNDATVKTGVPLKNIHYDAGFGRPLDYYTGFIFEIGGERLPLPLVGGGRYDRLLTLLGAKETIPGVGFSVWLDRVESLREARQ